MGKLDLEVHAPLQSCYLTESPATGTAFMTGVQKEPQTQKVGKRGCALCKIGAGENAGKGNRSANVASLHFEQFK